MSLMRCDNCHRQFDQFEYGAVKEAIPGHKFCSDACMREWEQKIHNQVVMQGLLASQRRQERAQAELQRQQEQQAQQERYQELNATAKEYGFTDAQEALKYAKQAGVAGTTDENEFFEKAAEKKREFEKFREEWHAHMAESNSKTERNGRNYREQLRSVMTEEQKEKYSVLKEESAKLFDIEKLKNCLFALELISVPFLGILLYKILPRSINFLRIYGFWSTLFTSVAIALILKEPIEIAISKNRVKKLAEIKGDDDFPFYELSFYSLSTIELRFCLEKSEPSAMKYGVWVLFTTLVFRYGSYIPITYLKWGLRIFSILWLIWLIFFEDMRDFKKVKDGFKFISTFDYEQYCVCKNIKKILGQFCLPTERGDCVTATKDYFSEWCTNEVLTLYGWKYTFLPEKENPEFKEKYGFLTSSKYFSIDDIREEQRKIEERNKKIHNEVRNKRKK